MKLVRIRTESNDIHHGVRRDDGSVQLIEGDPYGAWRATERVETQYKMLAPIDPPALVGIGLNYRHHAEEVGAKIPEYPIVFLKSPNSLQDPEGPIEIPVTLPSEQVDYECELAVVIGRRCKNVPRERALDFVLGYTCANDVSARDWQIARGGSQWCRGKSFDTFAPLGPWIVTADEIPDPQALGIKTILNGETVQDWTTGDMIFGVAELIEFLSASTTLLPGTVIMTGTPHGVGMGRKPPLWLKPGDVISVEIEGIGRLTNPVILEQRQRAIAHIGWRERRVTPDCAKEAERRSDVHGERGAEGSGRSRRPPGPYRR